MASADEDPATGRAEADQSPVEADDDSAPEAPSGKARPDARGGSGTASSDADDEEGGDDGSAGRAPDEEDDESERRATSDRSRGNSAAPRGSRDPSDDLDAPETLPARGSRGREESARGREDPSGREDGANDTAPAPADRSRADTRDLDALARRLGATPVKIARTCSGEHCTPRPLERFLDKLATLERTKEGTVRVLQLGDSQIAADYITRTIRRRLQKRFGTAGRGFVFINQKVGYGGRRLHRNGWKQLNIVDPARAGDSLGFTGIGLRAKRPRARIELQLEPDDAAITLFYLAHKKGARFQVAVGETILGTIESRSQRAESRAKTLKIPPFVMADEKPTTLVITAEGAGVRLMGISFESHRPGVFYDAVGPVGADAHSYLALGSRSFTEHLRALEPDLVVLMVGGNDALAMRRRDRSRAEVRTDFDALVKEIRRALPQADCMLWSPMDAGENIDGKIVSKEHITEVRDIERNVATSHGCAFWDTFEAMGGEGAFGRWAKAGIMNEDLVHPRSKAGDLLGHLFSTALLSLYDANGER